MVRSRSSTGPSLRTLDGESACQGDAHLEATKLNKSVRVEEGLRSGKPGDDFGAKSKSKWRRIPYRISHTKLWYGPVGAKWRATVPLGEEVLKMPAKPPCAFGRRWTEPSAQEKQSKEVRMQPRLPRQ